MLGVWMVGWGGRLEETKLHPSDLDDARLPCEIRADRQTYKQASAAADPGQEEIDGRTHAETNSRGAA